MATSDVASNVECLTANTFQGPQPTADTFYWPQKGILNGDNKLLKGLVFSPSYQQVSHVKMHASAFLESPETARPPTVSGLRTC